MKTIDRFINLTRVIAFFMGIFVILIKALNVFGYITITSSIFDLLFILLWVALGYLVVSMIIDVARIIEEGKSDLKEQEKKKNREDLVKMFTCTFIGTAVIMMIYYILTTL
jgi:predicted secreted protein